MAGSSTSDRQDLALDGVRASRALMVAMTPTGLTIPSYTGLPEIPLDTADLELILALAQIVPRSEVELIDDVRSRTDASAARLHTILDSLVERDLLVGSPAEANSSPGQVAPPNRQIDLARALVMTTPTLFRVTPQGFEHLDHDGRILARLSPVELIAASEFRVPVDSIDAAHEHHCTEQGPSLTRNQFGELVARLAGVGLVQVFDADHPSHDRSTRNMEQLRDALGRKHRISVAIAKTVAADDRADAEWRDGHSSARTPVVPVDTSWQLPPAALGLLVAYAQDFDGGRLADRYRFHQDWVTEPARLQQVAAEPGIFLFSNYLWNHDENLSLSAMVKELNPASVTIHGGPDTPKYPDDCERYFADNPHVDITVRGEGEVTFAEILDSLGPLGAVPPQLEVLADVAGLSYRRGAGAVHTNGRDRIEDLDSIPSPLLTGLFDPYAQGPTSSIILETNRGCPYGCTFCDWGSATLSRIRKFDLDRVFAELEWCARNKIETVSIGDANFGIFERDVAIAEKIAELKATFGFPKLVATNYAKNTVKHLRRIIEVFADADIVAEGVVSLQTMDENTLHTIRRKNIKVEKYNDLATEFRRNQLPLAVDLMLGLPGSTTQSFRNDMQECINRDVRVRIHPTQMLPNSPMNDPAYREEHGITARPGEYLEETNSYTRDEWNRMWRLAVTFLMGDLFGTLRQVAKFVRQETGLTESAFYERLGDDVMADQDRWPALAGMMRVVPTVMVPPVSWQLFMDEVHRYLLEVVGIADDDALATVLAVQHALLPAAGRQFPCELQLAHDYAAWHRGLLEVRDAGHRDDWENHTPRLTDFGPAHFQVDDPEAVCLYSVGQHMVTLSLTFASFELRSPVARARIKMREPVLA